MWIGYALGLNNEQLSRLTLKEFVNLWHGYIWRKQQQENMLAALVTVWIANTAGKSLSKNLSIENIFKDGIHYSAAGAKRNSKDPYEKEE